MTLNDLEWLFHEKMRFWPALLESERLNVRNSTTSAIDSAVFCAFHDLPIPIQLPQRNSASAAHVCAADALFLCGSWASCCSVLWLSTCAVWMLLHASVKFHRSGEIRLTLQPEVTRLPRLVECVGN